MTATTIRVQMAQRKDTAANWTSANPILLSGEIGYETDTKKFKIGNGSSNWNSLAYLPIPDGSGNLTITGNLEIGNTGSLTFEGSTADGFETTLAVTNPTADRTITLPDRSGTVITSGDTGTVTSTMLADGTIVNADISATAEIAVSKLANGTANQIITTDGTDVSWSSNLNLAGNATIQGDLTVNGTTTTIDTQTLLVEDKNIEMGVVATPTDVTADGGGITLRGTTNKTINWIDSTDSWTSSEHIDLASGKSYRINNTEVLSSTTLGSGVTASSLTSVGTLGSLTVSGSATAASFIPTSSTVPTNGVYLPAANSVAISTNSTGRLFIDSSGRVGVATNTPSTVFHCKGDQLRYEANALTYSPYLAFGTPGGLPGIILTTNQATSRQYDIACNGDSLTFRREGTEIGRWDSSGRLGIGSSSPRSNLDITKDGAVAAGNWYNLAHITDSAGNKGFQIGYDNTSQTSILAASTTGTASNLQFYTFNGSSWGPRATIDSSGRLLVGTSSTSRPSLLQIVQANQTSTSGQGNLGIFTNDTQAANIGAKLALGGQSGEANWLYASLSGRSENNSYAGYLQFGTSDAAGNHDEAARINSGKELLIGYTTDNGAYKLQVNSQIFATSATIATSDGRYKENIVTLDGCVDLVKALRPVSFTWKPQQDITRMDAEGKEVLVREGHNFPDGTQVGFIAQEVQEVLAEKSWLTSVIKQNVRPAVTDDDGNELAPKEEFLGIAEGNLIAVLTAALQEAIAKIETLEARLTAAGID